MSRATRESALVALLDWQGRLVWISERQPPRGVGFLAEVYAQKGHRELVKRAVSRVIEKRQDATIQVVTEFAEHYRCWLWPIDSQDVAACALAIAIPAELALLSLREQDCLKLLAHGRSAAAIAAELKIAVSTVHTHLRRARDKLKLPNLEALISFAARFCDRSFHPAKELESDLDRPTPRADVDRSTHFEAALSESKPDDYHVLLCDWQGRLNWSSKTGLYETYGNLAWSYVEQHDCEEYRLAFSRAMTLTARQQMDVDCAYGGRYRAWLWPLDWPEAAVCILAQRIPEEMALLTPREQECLEWLAFGYSVEKVAAKMDISTSTVHTLMRRARKKLHIERIEELISFAARYCYPKTGPFQLPGASFRSGT